MPVKVSIIGGYPMYKLGITNLLKKLNLRMDFYYHELTSDIFTQTQEADILVFFVTRKFRNIFNSRSFVLYQKNTKIIFLTPSKGTFQVQPTLLALQPLMLPLAIKLDDAEKYLHQFLVKNDKNACKEIASTHSIQSLYLQDIEKLTCREQQVFQLITEGKSNGEISQQLSIHKKTVKVFIRNIYQKFGICNKAQAVKIHFSMQYASC